MTDRMIDVRGRCPACGNATLFLADGGHITCSLADCPRPDLVNEVIGEIADARWHGAYSFCDQLIGHVTMRAFAQKITEKVTAVGQRKEAVAYANEQKQRAEAAEARIATALALHQPDPDGRTGYQPDDDDTPGAYGDIAQACQECGSSDLAVRWPCPTVTTLAEPKED